MRTDGLKTNLSGVFRDEENAPRNRYVCTVTPNDILKVKNAFVKPAHCVTARAISSVPCA